MYRKSALAGNRTRASRVAGENSTTEPPMLLEIWKLFSCTSCSWCVSVYHSLNRTKNRINQCSIGVKLIITEEDCHRSDIWTQKWPLNTEVTFEHKCAPVSSSGVGLFRVNKAGHVVKLEDVDSFYVFRLLNPPESRQQMKQPHILE